MSASLVGSEMCIRDRDHREAHAPLQRAHSEVRGADGGRPRAEDVGPLRACLLYTSDAADDM
eukprot:2968099-Alexandrium_andersonii.AAC.1